MKALSIRQPWAWLIVNGHKDIENRQWRTNYRGRFLIHAAATMTKADYSEAYELARKLGVKDFPSPMELRKGGLIGVAEVDDCVTEYYSPWFFGRYGFTIKNAQPIEFQQCKGKLNFFEPQTVFYTVIKDGESHCFICDKHLGANVYPSSTDPCPECFPTIT